MAIKVLNEVLPLATTAIQGAVAIGENLKIDSSGTLDFNTNIANVAGKAGQFLTNDGTDIKWGLLPNTAEIDRINSDLVTNTHLKGNQGNSIVNSKAANGVYVTLVKSNSTNGKMTINSYQDKLLVGYTSNTTVNAGTNALDKQLILLNEAGNSVYPGNIKANYFDGLAASAKYADVAENYKSDSKYKPGTLIAFGGEQEITIATKEVNGIISSKPGFLLNQGEKGLPVALCGKVKVRVIGEVDRFDKLILSKIPGVACKKKWYNIFSKTIAIALQENDNEEEKLVMCFTKASI